MGNRMPRIKRVRNWRNVQMNFYSSPRTWTTCTSALAWRCKRSYRFMAIFLRRAAHVVVGGRSSATPKQVTIAKKVGSRELAPPSLNSVSRKRGRKMAFQDVRNAVGPCGRVWFGSESHCLRVKPNVLRTICSAILAGLWSWRGQGGRLGISLIGGGGG